jgi:hypothetical protein
MASAAKKLGAKKTSEFTKKKSNEQSVRENVISGNGIGTQVSIVKKRGVEK